MAPSASAAFTPPGVVLSTDGNFDLGGLLFQDNQPSTVKYHLLSTLLLNEMQEQDRRIRVQG
jgi:hypothetical protein